MTLSRFKVVEGRSKTVAECIPAHPAANDKGGLAATRCVAVVLGLAQESPLHSMGAAR